MSDLEEIYQNAPIKTSKVKIPQDRRQPAHGVHSRYDEQHSTSHYSESQGMNHRCTWTNILLISLCVLLLCGVIILSVLYAIKERTLLQPNRLVSPDTDIYGSSSGQCSDGWELFNGTCYYFSHDVLNWTASKDKCVTAGGHLVIIDSKEEQIYIMQKIIHSEDDFWIGLTDSEREGYWTWVDNTDLKLKFWHQGQPNNQKSSGWSEEDCGIVRHVPQHEQNWFDQHCDLFKNRICEVESEQS